ncbi:hypothetical protein [Saccharibacillus endophyticus]|uniref:Uncharacterized protein n=1 Tax=Saccharibacillus endophyticus TaxID=2060666 RepID=A0ABQ1ZXU8_9BACL|nr:hypothetical protein [Saccharibacillus endophyticus]GGH80002.1 hypothetical protein GCM10007362_27650 [Saccharibacillus endophyticus]
MNKFATIAIGGILLLAGILLYLGVHIAAVLHMPNVHGWQTPPGHYGSAVKDSGGYWMFGLAIILIGLGVLVLVTALFDRFNGIWRSNMNDIRRRDQEFDTRRAESERQIVEGDPK